MYAEMSIRDLDVDNMIERLFEFSVGVLFRSFSCVYLVINSFRFIWQPVISYVTNPNYHCCSPLLWGSCYQEPDYTVGLL